MTSAWLRRLALGVVVLPALFALLVLRTLARGESELRASDRAFDAGELELALRHARHAAGAYVPGAGHVDAAYARLQAVAMYAEHGKDPELAARAWDAVRAGALETRHVWSARESELALADAELARLRGAPPAPPIAPLPKADGSPWLAAGFFGALASAFWFCAAAWSASGHWRAARASLPALGWCAGLLALGWALLHA